MNARARELGLEVVVYVALAWFAAAHWADGLVADAPAARVFACVVIGAAAGLALALSAAVRSRIAGVVLRLGCSIAALGAGVVAIGLDRSFLAPRNWGDLVDGLDRGFAGLGAAVWPYAGPEPWTRMVLLLAIPVVLSVVAGLSFWPGRRHPRWLGATLLAGLYGFAVTEHQFGGELARGSALLLLIAAWLWLPSMSSHGMRTVAVAAAAVGVTCLAALPAAARYDDRRPWVDYESWNPFEGGAGTTFDWSHSYGPIDWPRKGTTLLTVRSNTRHYWRVETLDRFDGFGWARSREGRGNPPALPRTYRADWERDFRVTIRRLQTDLFPVAGTALEIKGADPVVVPSEDGTVEAVGESLDEGDSYDVRAFVPNPEPDEMRAAAELYPAELDRYFEILLPPPGTTALDGSGRAGDAARSAIAASQVPATIAEIRESPYARMLRLARRLTRGDPTAYDKVLRVQRYLRSTYTYSERPPSQEFPLAAFLFEDRIGYCQQFSGAMALMLRMLGVPTRVAAGFSPGSYNRDTKEYRVRDLDAHSWVEVWFPGIGWVPFDPTPAIAPAESQSGADDPSASGGIPGIGETPDRRGGQSSTALSERAGGGSAFPSSEDSGGEIPGWALAGALTLLALAAAAAAQARAWLRRRGRQAGGDPDLAELTRALVRMGVGITPALTLSQLETLLASPGPDTTATYLRVLRDRRFAPGQRRKPGRRERRELRRALAADGGVLTRLRALAAVPPVAFRRG